MSTQWRWNPAPGWPDPGPDFRPPADWQPDLSWPAAPPGWPLWIAVEHSPDGVALPGEVRRQPSVGATVARWTVLALAALVVLGGLAAGGVGGALAALGLFVLVVAVVALVRGRLATFWLPGRRAAAAVAALGVATLISGSAFADTTGTDSPTASGPASDGRSVGVAPSTVESIAPTSSSPPASSISAVPAPTSPRPSTRPSTARVPRPPARAGTAAAALAGLTVKGRAAETGYDRAQFGSAWSDDTGAPDGHNGCDTRNDMLRRDLRPVTVAAGTHGCLVLSGTLHDPYTGAVIAFTRGVGTSTRVQIDHVVALSDAWQKGAQRWSAATRAAFGNDPMNLLAVDGPTNLRKSDGDAATWLPPNKSYRCAYVARQVSVKAKYRLSVTAAEHAAIAGVLHRCPNQPPVSESAATRNKAPHAAVRNRPAPRPAPRRTVRPLVPPAGGSTYYPNCDAVRAAGKAPLHSTDPGYSRKLDRDGDGTACE